MASQLARLNMLVNNVERLRNRNKRYYSVLLKKKKWDSLTQFCEAASVRPQSIYPFLEILEQEGLIELKLTYHKGRRVMIITKPEIREYKKIWNKHKKLDGLFKLDVLKLLSKYPVSFVALVLGYSGNASVRNSSLRATLTRLGWWKEFKRLGTI